MVSPNRRVYLSQEAKKAKAEEEAAAERQSVYENVLSCIEGCKDDSDKLLAKMPVLQTYFDSVSDLNWRY